MKILVTKVSRLASETFQYEVSGFDDEDIQSINAMKINGSYLPCHHEPS